jgi:hypothetical protein
MFHVKYLFYFILIHFIIATPQLNLYYTDGVREIDNELQHNCLHIDVTEKHEPVEHHQFYLNQLSTSNDLSLAKEIFL